LKQVDDSYKNDLRLIRDFAKFYRPHRKLFVIDMLCAFFVAACDLLYPLIAKNIINVYVPDRNMQALAKATLLLVLVYITKACLSYVVQYWGHLMGVRIQGDMRETMFRHLQKLPFSYFDDNKTGTIMSRLVGDLFDVSELAHHGPENLFLAGILFIGAFVILCRIDLLLTVIVFAILPFIVLFAVKMRARQAKAFMQSRVEMGKVNGEIETGISGVRVSRAYTAAEHEIGKFTAGNELFKKARVKAYKTMGQFHSGMQLLMDLLYVLVLAVGGLFFFRGRIDIGEYTAFLLYINMFLKPVQRLVDLFEQMQEGLSGLRRFDEVMQEIPEQDSENAVELIEPKGDIRFEHVTFHYSNTDLAEGKNVLSDLSLSIPAGKMVALVGPSGGGKTTLCHLIPRFYDTDSGRITIDGIDIRDVTRESLRRNIGIVAQDVFIFDGTIRENIAYGKLDATEEEILQAAKEARIYDFVMTLEKGFDTQVGERGVKLSGGQKQRLSIARVFLKNPPVLVLDEATSALDNATEMQIQQSLEDLSKGRTTLVVAHRLSTIRNADEIIVITKQGIEERGTHEQLVHAGGLYEQLYQYGTK